MTGTSKKVLICFVTLSAISFTATAVLAQNKLASANESGANHAANTIKRCNYRGSSLNKLGVVVSYQFEIPFEKDTVTAKANAKDAIRRFDPERIRYGATIEDIPADGLGFFFTTTPPARLLAPTECFDKTEQSVPVPVTQQELDAFQLDQALSLWMKSETSIPDTPADPWTATYTPGNCKESSCPFTKILPLKDARFDALAAKMKDLTLGDWGCPVGRSELSYLWVSHRDNAGRTAIGEIIVATKYAAAVATAFAELYTNNYPIERMRTQDYFQGEDLVSMAANNTSAFRCPKSDQGGEHPLGQAVDINPLHNPFIKPNERKFNPERGFESPAPASLESATQRYAIEPIENWPLAFWLNRLEQSSQDSVTARQIILPNSIPVRAFERIGWAWGGKWNCCADYQHFSKDNT
jgi:D-alanyl-D-alanine carboxypeptidase